MAAARGELLATPAACSPMRRRTAARPRLGRRLSRDWCSRLATGVEHHPGRSRQAQGRLPDRRRQPPRPRRMSRCMPSASRTPSSRRTRLLTARALAPLPTLLRHAHRLLSPRRRGPVPERPDGRGGIDGGLARLDDARGALPKPHRPGIHHPSHQRDPPCRLPSLTAARRASSPSPTRRVASARPPPPSTWRPRSPPSTASCCSTSTRRATPRPAWAFRGWTAASAPTPC